MDFFNGQMMRHPSETPFYEPFAARAALIVPDSDCMARAQLRAMVPGGNFTDPYANDPVAQSFSGLGYGGVDTRIKPVYLSGLGDLGDVLSMDTLRAPTFWAGLGVGALAVWYFWVR